MILTEGPWQIREGGRRGVKPQAEVRGGFLAANGQGERPLLYGKKSKQTNDGERVWGGKEEGREKPKKVKSKRTDTQ